MFVANCILEYCSNSDILHGCTPAIIWPDLNENFISKTLMWRHLRLIFVYLYWISCIYINECTYRR